MNYSSVQNIKFDELKTVISKTENEQILLVVDSEIQKNYLDLIKEIQEHAGKSVLTYISTSGEPAKSFSEFEKMSNFFLEKGIHRKSKVIAIGGGAVTDVAGFFAATALRGISWWVIPTTLLGMVDAAIGGKTALNVRAGKNLIGSFHRPEKVLIIKEFLKTLPEDQMKSGLGEIIKYGMINKELGDYILEEGSNLEKIIDLCARYKNEIASEDFTEKGLRQVLNFGHTLGHAIEKIYLIPHGESVFWGMYLITRMYSKAEDLELLKNLSGKLNTDFKNPPWFNKTFPISEMINYVKKDKKVQSAEEVNLIICSKERGVEIFRENIDELTKNLEALEDEFRVISL